MKTYIDHDSWHDELFIVDTASQDTIEVNIDPDILKKAISVKKQHDDCQDVLSVIAYIRKHYEEFNYELPVHDWLIKEMIGRINNGEASFDEILKFRLVLNCVIALSNSKATLEDIKAYTKQKFINAAEEWMNT